jgi:hypothetical protein
MNVPMSTPVNGGPYAPMTEMVPPFFVAWMAVLSACGLPASSYA